MRRYPPPMRPAWRIAVGLRRLLPVALCALGGHFALYRSLNPSTGDHAYFAWYEPLVVGLTLAALLAFGALLLAAVLGRDELRRAVVRVLLPAAAQSLPASVRAVRLTLASVAFLAAQETFERTLAEGRLAPAAFSPFQVLLVLVVLAALAALVALVERSCSELIALVVAPAFQPRRRGGALPSPAARPLPARRRNPLAELRGLRAPPLVG
jgi:hypothetical protein